MSSNTDIKSMPINVPSLCIPRVYPNIDEKRIRRTFNELKLGIIDRIDIASKTGEKGEKYNRVFIHFERWFNEGNALAARERLINGKDIKIIYDDPWFWKVSAYREFNKSSHHEKKKSVFIDFDSDEEKPSRTNSISRSNNRRDYEDRRPRRDYEDRRPRRDYEDRRPRRDYEDRRPRRDYKDRRPRRDYEEDRCSRYKLTEENNTLEQEAIKTEKDREIIKGFAPKYDKNILPPPLRKKKQEDVDVDKTLNKED